MLQQASELQPLHEQVERLQSKLRAYIIENEEFLRSAAIAEARKPEPRFQVISSAGAEENE